MSLLTFDQTKINKGIQFGYLTGILHLAPYNLSGRNVCPWASKGCAEACLNTAGRGSFSNVQNARIRKTEAFFDDRNAFLAQIDKEIGKALNRSRAKGLQLAIRLNGTSDLPWHLLARDTMEKYPTVQFYDYTKDAKRMYYNDIDNYDLTFSRSEENIQVANDVLSNGFRVAFVYRGDMPETFNGAPVVNGDTHDLRFLDPKHCAVALKAKGKAKKDTTGFVVSV